MRLLLKLGLAIGIIAQTLYLILRRMYTPQPWSDKAHIRVAIRVSQMNVWQFVVIAYIYKHGDARAQLNFLEIKTIYDAYKKTKAKRYQAPPWLLAHAKETTDPTWCTKPEYQIMTEKQKIRFCSERIEERKENKELANKLWSKVRNS